MALRSTTVTVNTTPTPLATQADHDYARTRDLMVHNPGPATIYVGDQAVTKDAGIPVLAGGSLAFDTILAADIPHAVTETGSVTVRVLEVGV